MRPHHLLEDMAALKLRLGEGFSSYVDVNCWQASESLLREAVAFDFTNYGPSEEHVDFGLDLLSRGVFSLPFPTCFFTWRSADRAQGVIVGSNALAYGNPYWSLITVGTCVLDGQVWETGFRVPYQVCLLDKADPMNSSAPIAPVLIGGENRQRNGEPVGDDVRYARAGQSMRFICGAISMLMSRDVSTRIEPVPMKLNAQRERKGKPPIGEAHVIKVNASVERHYREAGERFRTHASPKMHWRRGHFRTLHRGDENQRIVPVAPSLVGANDSARVLAPKEYVVR